MAKLTRNQKISYAMRAVWRVGNRICFDNKLPVPRFRVRSLEKEMAQALWQDTEKFGQIISVDPDAVKSGRYLVRLILHEMIHQLQWQQKSERTKREHHGRFFQSHCVRIKMLTGYDVFWPRG
jgi:hypothetical protein